MTKTMNPADAIRAETAAAARKEANHDKPLLDEAADVLAQIAVLADRLEAIAPELLVAYVPIHLTAIANDRRRAAAAVETARSAAAAVLVA